MKKRYLVIGALALSHGFVKAQRSDSLFKKEILNKTDITVLYNQYIQNGDHSAITGGIGTERLLVYAPAVELNSRIKRKNIVTFKGGADIITSASTDRIDFVLSSASLHDTRFHTELGYGRWFEKSDVLVTLGTGLSIESAYLSIPVNFKVGMIKSGCCGMAGSFGYEKEHYDVSMKVGELGLFPAVRNAAKETIIAAPGTSCRHQIKDGTGRTAFHPIEVLYDALLPFTGNSDRE